MLFDWVQRRTSSRRPAERRAGCTRGLQRAGRVSADVRGSEAPARPGAEKRHGERLRIDGRVKGEVLVFQPMAILDISAAGVQIQTAFPLQFQSEHDFRLSLDHRAVIVRGHVAYCHISELTDTAAVYRSGIRFVDVTTATAAAIEEFVSGIQPVRS